MKSLFKIGLNLASVACAVMAVPQACFAVQPTASSQQQALVVHDIALGNGGVLKGQIVTTNGQARAGVPVILGQQGKELVKATTNERGEFEFRGVPSGMFHVSTGSEGGMYRVWADKTAPPSAKSGVLIVNNDPIVRANLGEWWRCLTFGQKAFLVAGTATAIAVPIALAQDDDDDAS